MINQNDHLDDNELSLLIESCRQDAASQAISVLTQAERTKFESHLEDCVYCTQRRKLIEMTIQAIPDPEKTPAAPPNSAQNSSQNKPE